MTHDERILALARGEPVGDRCPRCKGDEPLQSGCVCHGTGRIRTTPEGPDEEAVARLRAELDGGLLGPTGVARHAARRADAAERERDAAQQELAHLKDVFMHRTNDEEAIREENVSLGRELAEVRAELEKCVHAGCRAYLHALRHDLDAADARVRELEGALQAVAYSPQLNCIYEANSCERGHKVFCDCVGDRVRAALKGEKP